MAEKSSRRSCFSRGRRHRKKPRPLKRRPDRAAVTILPLNPAENATPDALRAFLAQCRDAAARAGRPKLVSISLAVDALDPLAVLESIFEPDEPHFYTERPASETAIAGAEIALSHETQGAGRFAEVQRWVTETL